MNSGWLTDFFSGVFHIVKNISVPVDIIDILVITIILYCAYKFVKDRRAGRLAAGVIVFIIALLLCDFVGMHAVRYIFQNILQVGVVALLVLFQPEFRSALEKMGGSSIKGLKSITDRNNDNVLLAIREVCTACAELSSEKTGALIVFERTTKLGEIASTGSIIDAQTSSFLIRNIFFNKAPLHDGAVLISEGRIKAAGCLLPLSLQPDISRDLGTRHRAAIGMTENSDAIVVVVSEETGLVSVVVNGKITRGYNADTLRLRLMELLIHGIEKSSQKNKKNLRRKKNNIAREENQ